MSQPVPQNTTYQFGRFRLDASGRVLHCDAELIRLAPKTFDTLLTLVESQGRIVGKEELLKRIWPDTFVEEGSLAQNISILRRVLAKRADGEQFIQTIPKRGYRFVAIVSVSEAVPVQPNRGSGAPMPKAMLLLAVIALAMLASGIVRMDQAVRSLAVLPFDNLSGSAEQDYIADALTEKLITELAKFPKLRVISHTSAAQYRHAGKTVPEIARELRVDAVVEGGVEQSRDRVLIMVQLIRTSSDQVVWAQSYYRSAAEVAALQSEIASTISAMVRSRITAVWPISQERAVGEGGAQY